MTTARSPPSTPTDAEKRCRSDVNDTRLKGEEWGKRGVDGGSVRVSANRRGPVVPKGTLRAPVSPFQTTVWRYNRKTRAVLFCGGGGGQTKKRERWKERRRGGEQTDNHRRSQATIRMQTSMSQYLELDYLD